MTFEAGSPDLFEEWIFFWMLQNILLAMATDQFCHMFELAKKERGEDEDQYRAGCDVGNEVKFVASGRKHGFRI